MRAPAPQLLRQCACQTGFIRRCFKNCYFIKLNSIQSGGKTSTVFSYLLIVSFMKLPVPNNYWK